MNLHPEKTGPLHTLLKRQLKRHFGDLPRIPAEWQTFVNQVNEAYQGFDADRMLLERSLELSSQELLDTNSEMRAVFDAIPDLVFRISREGVILKVKAGADGNLMLERHALVGKRLQDLPHPDATRQFAEALRRVVAENAPVSIEYSAVLRGQESFFEARLAPLPDRQIVVIIHNITERKQSLRLLGTAVEQAMESVVITDAELDLPGPRILFVNPAFTRMTGYTAAEALGKTPRILQGPKSDRAMLDRLRANLKRGETFAGETVNYRKDGTELHIEWQVTPIHDTSGKTTHFVGIQRDITERKRMEKTLRDSEARYRTLFEGSADGIVIADSETKQFKYANSALCRMLGYTEAELCALGVADIHPPESFPHVVAEFEAQARGDKTLAPDLPCLRKDGSVFPADISAVKITIDGRPCNVGFIRDITERKQANEAVRMFQFASDNAADTIFWLDQNAGFYYVNDEACRALGYPREELMRLSLFDIDPFFSREQWAENWRRFRDKEIETIRLESRQRRKDGSVFPIEVIVKHLCFGGTELHLAFARDMTEHKRMEEALRMFRFASDNAADEIFWLDQNAGFYYVNDEACRSMGYTREELMRLNLFDIDPVFPKEKWEETWKKLENGQIETFRAESCHRRKDGSVFPIEVMAKHICLGNNLKLLLAVTRDMTERKRAEAIRQGSEQRLRALNVLQGLLLHPNPLEDKLKLVTEAVVQMVGADFARIWMIAPGDRCATGCVHAPVTEGPHVCRFREQCLHLLASSGRYPRTDGDHGRVPLGCYKIGQIAAGEETKFLTNDAMNDPRVHDQAWAKELGLVAFAGYRLSDSSGHPLGVLALFSKQPISAEEDLFLEGIAYATSQVLRAAQTEAALAYERDLLRTLLDQSPDDIYFKDVQSRFIKAGKAHARQFGLAFPEEMVGKTDFDFFTEEHARPAFEDEQEIIRTGVPIIGKVEKEVWQDGRGETWVLTTKMPFRDKDGKIIGTFGVSKDITAMKEAEAKLTHERARFKFVFENMPVGAALSRHYPDGRLERMINDAHLRISGLTPEQDQIPGIYKRITHPEDAVRQAELGRPLDDGRAGQISLEKRYVRLDGTTVWVAFSFQRHTYADGSSDELTMVVDITKRKQTEAELTYERDLLRTLMDQSPDKIYFKDTQSRFIKAGKSHADMFKVASPEELVGRTDFDFFTEEHARSAFEDEQEIIRTGVPVIDKVEKEVWQDGRGETWALTTKMPFRDKDGRIIGTFGISKDLTSLKQIEHALAYERDLFKMMMDQSPDSIYFKDLQSRFVRFSQAKVKRGFAAELARHTAAHPNESLPAHLASEERFAEYLVGKTDFDLFAEVHARPAFEDEQEIIRTGIPLTGKVEKETWLDGREAWVLTSKMPFRNNDGQIVGTFGVSKDITAMKQAEGQLRQLSRAVEQSSASIVITDPAGNITYVNPKFTAITGYTFAEALGKNPRILKSGETPAAAYTELWQTITAGKEWHGEFHNRKKNGELYWELASISPIFDTDGRITHFLGIKEDITARKRMEEQLFQSQKMETVGKLAGGVAHEFNSILTAIIGQSELLIEDLPPGDPLAQNAAEIHHAADRAAALTRQLLAYGRNQFLQPEVLDLNQVIAGMDETLRHLMGTETVSVNIIPAASLRLVKADAGQIEQVVINLALNARAAMPGGGKLTLETANVSFEPESPGRHPDLKPGSYVMLAITDTGVGMSEEVKARVFEPFFTTKDIGQGTGLGLATSYGIVKQSGGHISVHSELGRGTTFKIYLPQASAEPPRLPAPASSALPGGTETILLVEDDPALSEMAAALLRRLGYTVLTAANGVEALRLKQQHAADYPTPPAVTLFVEALSLKQPPATGHIDLLFTDVVMPHMSGKELSDRMRALYPHIRILFTSAYTENASIQQGVLDKDVAFLQKPFTPSALAHKVRELLDRPRP